MFLSVDQPDLGFSDVNCSVFSDSGTERNRGTDDDIDDAAPDPPGVVNSDQSKPRKTEDSSSHDDDDDIITSSRPDLKLFKDSPMREMLKAKDKSDDDDSNTQKHEIVLEDFLEPIGAFGYQKKETDLDDGGAQKDQGYSSQKCSGDEEDSQPPFGNVSRQHPLVERLVLPPNSDSENENTKRAHSDPGQYFYTRTTIYNLLSIIH